MPFIGALVGVLAPAIVAEIIHNEYSCYSDHSEYPDAAERRKKELASKIEHETRKLNSAREALAAAAGDAAAQMAEECELEGVELPGYAVRRDIEQNVKNAKSPDEVRWILEKTSEAFKKRVDDKLSAEAEEKRAELARVNVLLERVNRFRLTGRGQS
jgi:DNA anti-recombination protein RmuC